MNRLFTILLLASIFIIFSSSAEVSSADTVDEINFDQIGSTGEMKMILDTLFSESAKAKKEKRFTFDLQERILTKAGESINKILKLEKSADFSENKIRNEFKDLFLKNLSIFVTISSSNQEYINELQEEHLDKVKDVQTFFASDQWQMPQRLISLSRYWMSWNRYYSNFLYPRDDPHRIKILNEAIEGFSLALFNIEEQMIVIKSFFGRALCYKEIGSYDKAIGDLDAISKRTGQDDPLYVWSRYEKAVINYLSGDFGTARDDLEKLYKEVDEKRISSVIGNEHLKLQKKIILEPQLEMILSDLENEQDKRSKNANQLCHNALKISQQLPENTKEQADKLYQLVNDCSHFFIDLSFDALGAVGNLAMADRLFRDDNYEEAAKRYSYLCASSHFLIENRMDDIYFRSAYAYCQTAQWQGALSCFDTLIEKFPDSDFVDKAVCLQYIAAAGQYKKNPVKTCLARYIDSLKTYLDQCPDSTGKSEAHFQLGKHYHDKGKLKEALEEFSKIEKDSPDYWPAQYYILNLDMKKLESLVQLGRSKSKIAQKYYQEIRSQLQGFKNLPKNQRMVPGIRNITAYMTLLQARLYTFGPEKSHIKTIQILEGFEKRFPDKQELWLTANDLRLRYYRDHQMISNAKEEIRNISMEAIEDSELWSFLKRWSDVYFNEAKTLRHQGDKDSARDHAQAAIMLYEKLYTFTIEKALFKKYQNTIQLRLAELYMKEEQTSKAKVSYEEYLARNPSSADALYNLGLIYENESRWKDVLDIWRKFSKGIKDDSIYWFESRYKIALAHSHMGEKDKSCEILTMIQVLHPEFQETPLLEKILKLQIEVCNNR